MQTRSLLLSLPLLQKTTLLPSKKKKVQASRVSITARKFPFAINTQRARLIYAKHAQQEAHTTGRERERVKEGRRKEKNTFLPVVESLLLRFSSNNFARKYTPEAHERESFPRASVQVGIYGRAPLSYTYLPISCRSPQPRPGNKTLYIYIYTRSQLARAKKRYTCKFTTRVSIYIL